MQGRIHSIETMGLRDGPGIRVVVFMQGCRLRCRFCHNADTWEGAGGERMSPEELVARISRFRPYFKRSGGGVTFSGGEPLLQPDFLISTMRLCREAGIHTCLDTAGVGFGRYDEILSLTDLVLFDVKAIDREGYRYLCRSDIEESERFMAALRRTGVETVVRQVVVPGLNDSDTYMENLRKYIGEHLPDVRRVELLPYHRMGAHKFAALGMEEPLGETPAADREAVAALASKHFSDMM